MLAGKILPHAEIRFMDYPPDKPKIVGYEAKWQEDTFAYLHTSRSFEFDAKDRPLLKKIDEICRQCWKAFDLRGYARVDLRVNARNQPYVLEINANPCISPDSGFVAATQQAGLEFPAVIERIILDITP
jgi:D-alanine-D-alanine ligase